VQRLIPSEISRELHRLFKMYYIRIDSKNLSDEFSILYDLQRDAYATLLLNSALQYDIMKVYVNQERPKQ
jgi:hypothetical protein